jgi:hypothetical protein
VSADQAAIRPGEGALARWGVGQRVVRGYATLAGIASFGPVIEARPAAALLFGRQSQ